MKDVQDILIMFLLHTVLYGNRKRKVTVWMNSIHRGYTQTYNFHDRPILSILILNLSLSNLPIELLSVRAKLMNYCPVSPSSLVVTASNFIRDCMSLLLIKLCLEKLCFQNVYTLMQCQQFETFQSTWSAFVKHEMISSIC